jgi:hypothetical protein
MQVHKLLHREYFALWVKVSICVHIYVIQVLILGGFLQVIPQQKVCNLIQVTRHMPGHKVKVGEVLPPSSLLS